MIEEMWKKLDAKQRKLVVGTAIFVLFALILELAVFPFWDAKKKLAKSIKANQQKLVEMNKLAAEFEATEATASAIKRMAAVRGADFTLFSYLEKKATEANVRGRIKFMNSSKGAQSGTFEESLVDMRLDRITIKQLADFMYFAESPADLIRVKKISISKMKDTPEYLTVQLQISAIQPQNAKRPGR